MESQHPVGVAMVASGQSVGVATEQRGVGSGESKGRGRPGHRPSPGGRSLVLLGEQEPYKVCVAQLPDLSGQPRPAGSQSQVTGSSQGSGRGCTGCGGSDDVTGRGVRGGKGLQMMSQGSGRGHTGSDDIRQVGAVMTSQELGSMMGGARSDATSSPGPAHLRGHSPGDGP